MVAKDPSSVPTESYLSHQCLLLALKLFLLLVVAPLFGGSPATTVIVSPMRGTMFLALILGLRIVRPLHPSYQCVHGTP